MPPPRKQAPPPPPPPPPPASEGEGEGEGENTVTVPPELLQRLLQEFFEEKKKTRISQPALSATGEYTKTFIREAIWRAAAIRKESEGGGGGEGGEGGKGRGGVGSMSAFLEVEDLEKLSPQLLLDF